ncbi:hypothetical protein Dimus_022307, partial [Dionaea muscipula]
TRSDDEIVTIIESKGKHLPNRRSERMTSGSSSRRENVKRSEKKRKVELKQKREEEPHS